ncbi:hypothetical protein [Catenuloplanes japonicus]|uniref:hypothetical protein n=1 Tax=Catenuloplanes japonicus TaxID=33876 RepID=UPI0012FBA71F|nr:hypothetical protein [Catenuloplanes japonicus]
MRVFISFGALFRIGAYCFVAGFIVGITVIAYAGQFQWPGKVTSARFVTVAAGVNRSHQLTSGDLKTTWLMVNK